MSDLLFGVRPSDPASYIASALLLGGVALPATYIRPARRASRLDPTFALRGD